MSRVKLRLADDLLIQHMLRLGNEAQLVGAHVTGHALVLEIELPQAPDGADEAVPMYVRATDAPDPVQVIGIEWRRKGEVIAVDKRGSHPLINGTEPNREG